MGSTCVGQYEYWDGTFQVHKTFVKSILAHQTCSDRTVERGLQLLLMMHREMKGYR